MQQQITAKGLNTRTEKEKSLAMFMCYFQFQGNNESTEEKSQKKKQKSVVNVDNPSQNIWLESQDGDSSLEYLHLQSMGKRESDKLSYMKP